MADLAVWQRTIVDEEGNVVPGAEVEVRREEDDSLATLYADRAGETPLANPLAADMSGFVRFFAQGDAYTITAVGAGSTRTWRFDPTGRLQEFDRVSEALNADGGADIVSARSNLGTFSTVADVQNSHIPAVLESIRTFGRNAPGDGPPLNLVRGLEVPGAVQSADGQWWEDVGYNTITVRIPSDFPSEQAAVDHYSRLPMRRGARVVILFESGFEPVTGISATNGNYSYFVVRSEDPVVNVSDDFAGASAETTDGMSTGNFIVGKMAAMPVLDCRVNMKGLGQNGYYAIASCTGYVTPGSGVNWAGNYGILARTSFVFAEKTSWSDAYSVGIRAQHGGVIGAQAATADRCCKKEGSAAVRASRGSLIHFVLGKARDSGARGCLAIRGQITAEGSDFSGAELWGIDVQQKGVVRARDATVNDCLTGGIRVRHGSDLDFMNGECKRNGGYGLRAEDASSFNARGATFEDNTTYNVYAQDASRGSLAGASLTGAGTGVRIEGGNVSLRGATVRGATTSSLAIYAGGIAHALGAYLRKVEGVDDPDDIRVRSGGIVFAQNAEGGTNITPNTMTDDGIIWKN